jgi:hypothetical protein
MFAVTSAQLALAINALKICLQQLMLVLNQNNMAVRLRDSIFLVLRNKLQRVAPRMRRTATDLHTAETAMRWNGTEAITTLVRATWASELLRVIAQAEGKQNHPKHTLKR